MEEEEDALCLLVSNPRLTPQQFGTFKQAQRVQQFDAQQPELGFSRG